MLIGLCMSKKRKHILKEIISFLFLATMISATTQCMKIDFFNLGSKLDEVAKTMTPLGAIQILSEHDVFDRVVKVTEQKYAEFISTANPNFTKRITVRFHELLQSHDKTAGKEVFVAIVKSMDEYFFSNYFTQNRRKAVFHRTSDMPENTYTSIGKNDFETFFVQHTSSNLELHAAIEVFSEWYFERLRSLRCWMLSNNIYSGSYQNVSPHISKLILHGILRDYLAVCDTALRLYYDSKYKGAVQQYLYCLSDDAHEVTLEDFLIDFGVNLTFGCYVKEHTVLFQNQLKYWPHLKKVTNSPKETNPTLYMQRRAFLEDALKFVFRKIAQEFTS